MHKTCDQRSTDKLGLDSRFDHIINFKTVIRICIYMPLQYNSASDDESYIATGCLDNVMHECDSLNSIDL